MRHSIPPEPVYDNEVTITSHTSKGYTTARYRDTDRCGILDEQHAYRHPADPSRPGQWRCAATGKPALPPLATLLNDALSLYLFKKSQEEPK